MIETTKKASCGWPQGCQGFHGPNDGAYAVMRVRDAAEDLQAAISFWCVGYGYHNDKLAHTHPLYKAMKALQAFDRKNCHLANEKHDPELFDTDRHGKRFWIEGHGPRKLYRY